MIQDIQEAEWTVEKTGRKYICKTAKRVCDACGKTDLCRLTVIKANRRERGSDKDYCYSCAQRQRTMPKGPAYAKWRHGKTYNGYNRITVGGKRILEHVHVMEEFLKRDLIKGEIVHHIDMDKSNNAIANLYIFKSQADHQRCHITMEDCGFKLFEKSIWFDWDKKQYTPIKCALPENQKIKIKDIGKLHEAIDGKGRKKYLFYNEKNELGVWQHRKYHVLVAESKIGRSLFKNECVHHVDGDSLNNTDNNICVLTRIEHGQAHASLQKIVAEFYKSGLVVFENGKYFLKGDFNEKVTA